MLNNKLYTVVPHSVYFKRFKDDVLLSARQFTRRVYNIVRII